ncbi:MAG: cobalamin-binding protein [Nitrososphaerales archaeon]
MAKRIVTTLPSATEIISLLGLEDRLVGITHECNYPPSIQNKPVVMKSVFDSRNMTSKEIDDAVLSYVSKGRSIYQINDSLLQQLHPDLIITQELCEVCATPLQLVAKSIGNLRPKPKVISLSPNNLEDVLLDIIKVGRETGKLEQARKVVASLQERIQRVKDRCRDSSKVGNLSVFCLEWLDPIYNSGHWMPELVMYAGGKEILGRLGEPSTAVAWEKIVEADPEVIFVTVCGYKVERTLNEIGTLTGKKEWKTLRAVRNDRVFVLDSPSYFSRSGPRLVDGLEIMAFLLHQDLFLDYHVPKNAAFSLTKGIFIS